MNWTYLFENYEEAVAMILFGIGFSNLLLQRNLIKKIIGLNIMDTATYLFLALKGYIAGRKAPVVVDRVTAGAYGHRGVGVGDGADAVPDHPPVPQVPHAGFG